MARIIILKEDITKLNVDCIVNAANEGLRPGGGVCGAIFGAAGYDEMDVACRKIGHCDTGNAVITPGFSLKAKYVVHAVGPVWSGGGAGEERLLYQCYQSSIRLAEENGCRSIAFPIISSGIYGYPKKEAWEVAVRAADEAKTDVEVYFAVLDDGMLELGREAYYKVFNRFNKSAYMPGIFDEYKNELNPEHWAGFPELMWDFGFQMDCYQSAPVISAGMEERISEKERQDAILDELEQWPVRIVGNYIFSRYRELTHWCDYGYPEEQGNYFFVRAFDILEDKMKKEI